MKTLRLILLFSLFSLVCKSQNQFVYIHYDPAAGNPAAIVEMVEKLQEERGRKQIVVFLSTNDRSLLARTPLEWLDLRGELLTMQSKPEFYARNDARMLNNLFAELFNEYVTDDMHIKGRRDADWMCHFIVSQEMLFSVDMESVLELISLNELIDRMKVTVRTYDASNQLRFILTMPPAKFIDYGFAVQSREEVYQAAQTNQPDLSSPASSVITEASEDEDEDTMDMEENFFDDSDDILEEKKSKSGSEIMDVVYDLNEVE